MGDLDIRFGADDQDLIKSQAKLIKQQDQMIDGYKKMLREAKKAAKDGGSELERFAEKTHKINRTPMQKYKEEVRMLNKALQAGMITQETYNRAVARLKETSSGSFASMQSGIVGVGVAMAGVIAQGRQLWGILEDYTQKSDELANRQRDDAAGLGKLVQLAKTSEELAGLEGEAKKTFAEGGAKTLGQAADTVFGLHSAGAANMRKLLSGLAQYEIIDAPDSFVAAANSMITNFGEQSIGGVESLFSKALGASEFAPSKADALLAAAARGAQSAKALGISDEELLALTAQMASASKSAEMGGTQTASFMRSLREASEKGIMDFQGKGLLESVRMIRDSGASPRDILGDRAEAMDVYDALNTASEIFARNLAGVEQSQKDRRIWESIDIAATSDTLRAVRAQRIAANREQLVGEQRALRANYTQALTSDVRAGFGADAEPVSRYMAEAALWGGRVAAGDRIYTQMLADLGSEETTAAMSRSGMQLGGKGRRAAMIDLATSGITGDALTAAIFRTQSSMVDATGIAELLREGLHKLNGTYDKMNEAAGNLRSATGETSNAGAARANQAAVGGAVEAR